jgi:hypothetical protein
MLSGALLAALVAVLTVAVPGTASAETTSPGSYGCATDTIAATKINGLTYTATEKTCVEIFISNGVSRVRTHGVTRCYRSGSPFDCLIINGDSVITHLWINGVLVDGTAPGDTDCSNCHENSHYSEADFCIDLVESFQGREANLRVAWVSGVISDLKTHNSFPVNLRC